MWKDEFLGNLSFRNLQGGEIKRNLDMEETAIQPLPACRWTHGIGAGPHSSHFLTTHGHSAFSPAKLIDSGPTEMKGLLEPT